MKVTIDAILALKPCGDYPRRRLAALFAGRESVTPSEIAGAVAVPARDRAWLLLRLAPREVWLPAAYRSAERAIRHASWALHSYGYADASERLANLPPIVDAGSASAASDAAYAAYAASDAASDAAYAASGAASAASDAASAASDAAYAASAASDAAEWALFLTDVAKLLEAGQA